MFNFLIVKTAEEYKAAADLFEEYAQWLGIDLGFQDFEKELQSLSNMYSAPTGGIILCKDQKNFIASVAIRKFSVEIAELKRMYVQPAFQRNGIGKKLVLEAIALAKALGYKKIVLDTLNTMTPAISLYKEFGFKERAAYYNNPIDTAVYFEKEL